jgi:hypothetical protein
MLAYEGFDIEEEIDLDKIIMQEKENKLNVITRFDDGKVVVGNQKLKHRLSPNRGHSEKSNSPVGNRRTPSASYMSRASMRKSS